MSRRAYEPLRTFAGTRLIERDSGYWSRGKSIVRYGHRPTARNLELRILKSSRVAESHRSTHHIMHSIQYGMHDSNDQPEPPMLLGH